jgi:hypothetical protein
MKTLCPAADPSPFSPRCLLFNNRSRLVFSLAVCCLLQEIVENG